MEKQMLARSFLRKRHGLDIRFQRDLSLACTLHKPALESIGTGNEPIVILHGLFGSKQNNRSISKYGILECPAFSSY